MTERQETGWWCPRCQRAVVATTVETCVASVVEGETVCNDCRITLRTYRSYRKVKPASKSV